MSAGQGTWEAKGDSESYVFEIVLPISVVVLSDDDFDQSDADWPAALVPGWQQDDEQELNSNTSSSLTPLHDDNSLSICEENRTASSKANSTNYPEEKCIAERMCNSPKSYFGDLCDAGRDKCSQNEMLPMSSYKTEPMWVNEITVSEECERGDGLQKIPPHFPSAGDEGGDETVKTSRELTLVELPRNEEQLDSVASFLLGCCQEEQPEIYKDMDTSVVMEDGDSFKTGNNGATPSSHLESVLKEEEESTSNCFDSLLNVHFLTAEELLKDEGKSEVNASISTASDTTGEPDFEMLTPFPKKAHLQQKVVSYASPKEFQSQQDLGWISSSVIIKPLSKASVNKQEKRKCRFCSSMYKSSAHLKRHIYSAHKDKKNLKCCFCKRTFFSSVNLNNHLKVHKKMMRLQKVRKKRINARKIRQRSEERKLKTKKKESKYDKFFFRLERDFTSLPVPVSFSCQSCSFASSSPRIFLHHIKGHEGRPPYQCPQCDYSCVRFSYLLNHMYWHAGYKLYQCKFCSFCSSYFTSMVRHSYVHMAAKPYSCEFCQLMFTNASSLNEHRQSHQSKEKCQVQQLNLVRERKRAQRPVKNYTCNKCHVVFYTRGHLRFHKKYHKQFKATANDYMDQSNGYHQSNICEADSNSQDDVSLPLAGKDNDCLTGGMLASEVKFEQAGNVTDNKKMCSKKKFPKNGHGSKSLPILGNKSEVPLNSYKMENVIFKDEPLFQSRASVSRDQDDDAYHRFVENLKNTWPSNLCTYKTYRCQCCSYATAVHSDFKLHLQMHTEERPFVCKECNKTFQTSNHLQKHSLMHVNNGYKFGHCLFVDGHLENLELHYEMHVGICPERDLDSLEGSSSTHSLLGSEVCGAQPGVQRGRKKVLLAQSQPRFYQCAECEYTTYSLSNLELHVRTHTGEKPYSCSVCQKKFRTSSHLRRHRFTHLNLEHLKCRHCDYSTNKWPALKQHLASHPCEGSLPASVLCEPTLLPVKTYTCEACNYCTVHHGNFKAHLRIHTGEKPFKCDQCALAFRTSSHLKRHILTHLRLRCRKCRFSTADKRAFQKHRKTHVKMYKCVSCHMMLSTRKILAKHKRQHHSGV